MYVPACLVQEVQSTCLCLGLDEALWEIRRQAEGAPVVLQVLVEQKEEMSGLRSESVLALQKEKLNLGVWGWRSDLGKRWSNCGSL